MPEAPIDPIMSKTPLIRCLNNGRRYIRGSTTTTEAVRCSIQAGQESLRALAQRHGISPTTVQKWRKRTHTTNIAVGPKTPRSTVLSPRTRLSASRSGGTPYSRLTIASTPCNPACRT